MSMKIQRFTCLHMLDIMASFTYMRTNLDIFIYYVIVLLFSAWHFLGEVGRIASLFSPGLHHMVAKDAGSPVCSAEFGIKRLYFFIANNINHV